MPRSAPRRVRVLSCVVSAVLVGAALAGCSSSAPAELTVAPAVTGNGKHYVYAPGSVAMSSWPKVCALLPAESAAAAIGTAVVTKTFHHRCFYIPGNDAFPTLTVTILGIGSNKRDAYDQVRDAHARFKPQRVRGIGRAAVLYDVSGSPTVNLDLLADQGLFEIAVRSPVGNVLSAADARTMLLKVGRALNSEFAG